MRRPAGRPARRRPSARSIISCGARTRSIPAARQAASMAAASLASAPVCERTARAVASVCSIARRTTCLPAARAAWAAAANARPSRKSST